MTYGTPWIDVTEVLLDPMVAGEVGDVYAVRRLQHVSQGGIVSALRQVFAIVASITPTGDNSLAREEAFQTQSKSIKVITGFLLRGVSGHKNGQKFQPDLVWWKGDYYLVKDVSDFSSYGGGLIEADCSSIDFEDEPPSRLRQQVGATVFNLGSFNSGLVPCCSTY